MSFFLAGSSESSLSFLEFLQEVKDGEKEQQEAFKKDETQGEDKAGGEVEKLDKVVENLKKNKKSC